MTWGKIIGYYIMVYSLLADAKPTELAVVMAGDFCALFHIDNFIITLLFLLAHIIMAESLYH